jgi:hypothetical protein
MVLQWQPVLAWGSRRAEEINFSQLSIRTRFLFSVMLGQTYLGAKHKNRPLHALVERFATELRSCFEQPIEVDDAGVPRRLSFVLLGTKGDLPALMKLGRLERHFLRDCWRKDKGAGICHLCLGGQNNKPWHLVDYHSMCKLKEDMTDPWPLKPELLQHIPHSPGHAAEFFRLDVFHTFHKGVLGDAAANIIVSGVSNVHFSTFFVRVFSLPSRKNPQPQLSKQSPALQGCFLRLRRLEHPLGREVAGGHLPGRAAVQH